MQIGAPFQASSTPMPGADIEEKNIKKLTKEELLELYRLAYRLETGDGIDKNEAKAARLYRMAAEAGEVNAQGRLGRLLMLGIGTTQDRIEAVSWFEKVLNAIELGRENEFVDQNALKAKTNLAICLLEGTDGVERNWHRGMDLMHDAIAKGLPSAQYIFAGWLSDRSHQLKEDQKRASELYQAAAMQDHKDAQCELAQRYLFGKGIGKDAKRAAVWFRNAALQGDTHSQFSLGRCYLLGLGVAQGAEEAVHWLQRASVQNHAGSCAVLSGGDHNLQTLLQRLVTFYENDLEAKISLANCLIQPDIRRDEKEIKENEKRAFQLINEVPAESRDAACWFWLGEAFELGRGVAKNDKEAIKHYSEAADNPMFKSKLEQKLKSCSVDIANFLRTKLGSTPTVSRGADRAASFPTAKCPDPFSSDPFSQGSPGLELPRVGASPLNAIPTLAPAVATLQASPPSAVLLSDVSLAPSYRG